MSLSRRTLLKSAAGSTALIALSHSVPGFLLSAAEQASKSSGQRTLVVIQLSGGNDGLNTIVPFTDPEYKKNRFALAIAPNQVLKIDKEFGFNPNMGGIAKLLEAGHLSIVQGVGYPNPNRSHFESMDLWHTAHIKSAARPLGWLGRYLDASAKTDGRDVPALHLGEEKQPLALSALNVSAPSVRSLERFKVDVGGNESLRRAIAAAAEAKRPEGNELLDFVQQSTSAALTSSRRVEQSLGAYNTPVKYPTTNLAKKLKSVAQLIDAGLSTRIYYLALDGFDTHSNQLAAHSGLLSELSGAVEAFWEDLTHHGHSDRTLLFTFSEFGRRVKENASQGTDHGAAAPMLFVGGRLKPGLVGAHPSLTNLDDGDLKHHTDYRQVYATVLEDWLGWPSEPILGGTYKKVGLFSA